MALPKNDEKGLKLNAQFFGGVALAIMVPGYLFCVSKVFGMTHVPGYIALAMGVGFHAILGALLYKCRSPMLVATLACGLHFLIAACVGASNTSGLGHPDYTPMAYSDWPLVPLMLPVWAAVGLGSANLPPNDVPKWEFATYAIANSLAWAIYGFVLSWIVSKLRWANNLPHEDRNSTSEIEPRTFEAEMP